LQISISFAVTVSTSGNGLSNKLIFASDSDNQTLVGVHNTLIGNDANQ
jgi:hypothetical protein